MTTSDDDDDLFRDIKALALRYGVVKCQEALDATKLSLSPKVITKNFVHPCDIDLSHALGNGFEKLMRWSLFESCIRKLSLRWTCDPLPRVLDIMDDYYDSIRHQLPTETPSRSRRVESRFHTLHLYASQTETAYRVLERKKCVALFERVVLHGGNPDIMEAVVRHDIVDRIMDLVVIEGAISSLAILECLLCHDQALQLAGMLETNHLESLEVQSLPVGRDDSSFLGQALTDSLRCHVQMFAGESTLRILNLHDTLDRMDFANQSDLVHVIGILPRLESFAITTRHTNLLEMLAGGIANWKIRNFKLLCEFDIDTVDTDFRPLFDAIARSRHIKAFSFGCRGEDGFLPSLVSKQLFDLALSPTSGLLDIDLYEALIDIRQLSALVPQEVDPDIATRRQLRRFDFVQDQIESMVVYGDYDNGALLTSLEALLTLLSKQLPLLHSIGLTIDDWTLCKEEFCDYPPFFEVWDQILVQIENNHVGMALFQPVILPSVPGGLWAAVLNRAIAYDQDPEQLPWIGIYHMVRELLEGGYSRWSEVATTNPVGDNETIDSEFEQHLIHSQFVPG